MATRLYPAGTGVPISPTFRPGWEVTSTYVGTTRYLSPNTVDFAVVAGGAAASGVANNDCLRHQYVVQIFGTGTVSGTLKGQMGARETNAATDARAQLTAYIVSSDGTTVRGVLLDFDAAALSSEFVNVSPDVNRKFPRGGAQALSSVAFQNGDWIVVEFGWRNHGTGAGTVRVVTSNQGASATFVGDLPEDETTTDEDLRGWFEFSQDLPLAATVSASGAITPTGALTNQLISSRARSILISGVEYSEKIRLDSFIFHEAAYRGEVGVSGFMLDDAAASLAIPALKAITVDDTAASPTRLFTGYTHRRSTQRGPQKVAGQREWDVEVLDVNILASDFILSSAGANRSSETDYVRVSWLLSTVFNTVGGVSAGIVPNSNTATMDAVDYRGKTPRDVLDECSEASGKNWFIYRWDTGPLLFYDLATSSFLASTLRISDVASDVDQSTTFAPIGSIRLTKTPDDVYSTVRLKYKRGTVTVTNATTLSTYRRREKSLLDLSVKTSTRATNKANRFLAAAATERSQIHDLSVRLPRAKVNDIRAGQRLELKLTRHGISAFTWYRVLNRSVEPLRGSNGVSDVEYLVTLTLAETVEPTIFGSPRGGDEIWEEKSNSTDDGATVIVDSGGITVTDGAITVTNAAATVIIDGSSNMFKILATGTMSVTPSKAAAGNAVETTTTLTGLGTFSAPCAYLGHTTGSTAVTSAKFPAQDMLALIDGADPYTRVAEDTAGTGPDWLNFIQWYTWYQMNSRLNASDQQVVGFYSLVGENGTQATRHARYYVLAEAAF